MLAGEDIRKFLLQCNIVVLSVSFAALWIQKKNVNHPCVCLTTTYYLLFMIHLLSSVYHKRILFLHYKLLEISFTQVIL